MRQQIPLLFRINWRSQDSKNFPVFLYSDLPRDNFLPRINRIEELCPREFYILFDNKFGGPIRSRMKTEEGFKTIYGLKEIGKYIKINIDWSAHKEI